MMQKTQWEKIKTKHGYAADEVISALQKSIRRGEEKQAVIFGYELVISGETLADKFWQRIRVISAEDVGLAQPMLIMIIYSLHQNFLFLADKEDRFLHAILAIILLVRSAKSRYIDELYTNIKYKIENEHLRIPIPKYALDMHTKEGKKQKKDELHFWKEGSKLVNDISTNEKQHLNEIINRLEKKKIL